MFLAGSLSGTSEEGFSGQPVARQAGDGDLARDLALGPRRRILAVEGHEAAIDEDEAAVGEFERRIDVVAGLALPVAKKCRSPPWQERAGRRRPARSRRRRSAVAQLDLGKRQRRSVMRCVDGGDQASFQGRRWTCQVPSAEQHDEARSKPRSSDEPREAAGALASAALAHLVQPALGGLVGDIAA